MSRQIIKDEIENNLLPDQSAEFISPELERDALDLVIDGSFNLEDDDSDDIAFDDDNFSATNVGDAIREVRNSFSFGFGNLAITAIESGINDGNHRVEISGGIPNRRIKVLFHMNINIDGSFRNIDGNTNATVFIDGIEIGFVDLNYTTSSQGNGDDALNHYPSTDNKWVLPTDNGIGSALSNEERSQMSWATNPQIYTITLDSNGQYVFSDNISYQLSRDLGLEAFRIQYSVRIIDVEYIDVGFDDRSLVSGYVVPSNQLDYDNSNPW